MLCIYNKASELVRFIRVCLKCNRLLDLSKLSQFRNSIISNLELEIVKRMTAHEHARYLLLMVQQFGQRPRLAVWNLGRYNFWHFKVAKKCVTRAQRIRLKNIAEPDNFFKP